MLFCTVSLKDALSRKHGGRLSGVSRKIGGKPQYKWYFLRFNNLTILYPEFYIITACISRTVRILPQSVHPVFP